MATHNNGGWAVKREVSIGDAVAIAVALASMAAVYFKLDTRVALTERDVMEIKLNLAEMKKDIKDDLRDIKQAIVDIRDKMGRK